ncbi:MAG: hypothetical protein OSB03_01930 [Vicinamibacterales bacterium]|nr:hypothetical protein [Vicinamibacterales bacterium]
MAPSAGPVPTYTKYELHARAANQVLRDQIDREQALRAEAETEHRILQEAYGTQRAEYERVIRQASDERVKRDEDEAAREARKSSHERKRVRAKAEQDQAAADTKAGADAEMQINAGLLAAKALEREAALHLKNEALAHELAEAKKERPAPERPPTYEPLVDDPARYKDRNADRPQGADPRLYDAARGELARILGDPALVTAAIRRGLDYSVVLEYQQYTGETSKEQTLEAILRMNAKSHPTKIEGAKPLWPSRKDAETGADIPAFGERVPTDSRTNKDMPAFFQAAPPPPPPDEPSAKAERGDDDRRSLESLIPSRRPGAPGEPGGPPDDDDDAVSQSSSRRARATPAMKQIFPTLRNPPPLEAPDPVRANDPSANMLEYRRWWRIFADWMGAVLSTTGRTVAQWMLTRSQVLFEQWRARNEDAHARLTLGHVTVMSIGYDRYFDDYEIAFCDQVITHVNLALTKKNGGVKDLRQMTDNCDREIALHADYDQQDGRRRLLTLAFCLQRLYDPWRPRDYDILRQQATVIRATSRLGLVRWKELAGYVMTHAGNVEPRDIERGLALLLEAWHVQRVLTRDGLFQLTSCKRFINLDGKYGTWETIEKVYDIMLGLIDAFANVNFHPARARARVSGRTASQALSASGAKSFGEAAGTHWLEFPDDPSGAELNAREQEYVDGWHAAHAVPGTIDEDVLRTYGLTNADYPTDEATGWGTYYEQTALFVDAPTFTALKASSPPPKKGKGDGPGGDQSKLPKYRWREGDWKCPACKGDNFASRTVCFKCDKAKPSGRVANASNFPSCPPDANTNTESAAEWYEAQAHFTRKGGKGKGKKGKGKGDGGQPRQTRTRRSASLALAWHEQPTDDDTSPNEAPPMSGGV